MEWKADIRELNGLKRWYGKQPRLMRQAVGGMLNEFAFGTRTRAIGQINQLMTVRNPKFVQSRIRISKANIHAPVATQRSETGSVAGPRFSGWVEQEYGRDTKRNRLSTLAGRGGSDKKQMRHIIRLKPKHEVVTIDHPDFNPRGGSKNLGGFMAMIIRRKDKRLIRIKGSIYKRNRKKLQLVQKLKKVQPKRVRWMRRARAMYFRHTNLDALWSRIAGALVQPPSKL